MCVDACVQAALKDLAWEKKIKNACISQKSETVYLCRCHTDRQTSPTCNTPQGWWEGLWYQASSAEQTGWVRQLENWAWWRTRAASRRTTWWCSPTSCRRSQRWHKLLWKTVSKLKKRRRKKPVTATNIYNTAQNKQRDA